MHSPYATKRITSHEEILARIRKLSILMDSVFVIPIINRRVGLDALIGLVPGVGDAAGMLVSAYIIWEAAKLEPPKSVLGLMILNVAIETIVGIIPLLGDLFDAGWKANLRNLRLLEKHLQRVSH